MIIATKNQGKLVEFAALLAPLGISVQGLDKWPDLRIVEDGETFEANAIKKAQTIFLAAGEPVLADDSGLVVDALNGAPGVYSARYAGPEAKDADNRAKLLAAMQGVPEALRTARFVCVLAYVDASGVQLFKGFVEGRITETQRGTSGFGYDSVFLIPELGQTFGEISAAEKNRRSHRGRALQQFIEAYENVAHR